MVPALQASPASQSSPVLIAPHMCKCTTTENDE